MRKITLLGACTLAMFLTMRANPVNAEFLADVYIGPAFTQDDRFAGAPMKFDDEVSFGGRVGYYFPAWHYFGVALDLSHYRPDGRFGGIGSGFRFESKITGLSFDAMLRLPLMTSNTFPHGQIQPYVTLGPGVYFSRLRVKPFGGSDSSTDAGVKVGGGLTYMLSRNVGLLGEYRFSHFSPKYRGAGTDINTHRLQFGATLRF